MCVFVRVACVLVSEWYVGDVWCVWVWCVSVFEIAYAVYIHGIHLFCSVYAPYASIQRSF